MQRLDEEVEGEEEKKPVNETKPSRCCTLAEVRARPEIVLWYIGNCLSYLGFYMPFVNLVSVVLQKPHEPGRSCSRLGSGLDNQSEYLG